MFEGYGDPVVELDRLNAEAGAVILRMLETIRLLCVSGSWRGQGARDLPHWISMRYGISWWKARRMLSCSRALVHLPLIREALGSGALSLDKAMELCRFASSEEERALLAWARRVSVATVRERANLHERRSRHEVIDAEHRRSVSWYWMDDGSLALEADLPAAQGAVVVKAVERMVARIPVMPGEEGSVGVDARRADALVALCSARLASDPDKERSQIVVHAPAEKLAALAGERRRGAGRQMEGPRVMPASAWIEGGPAIHDQVLARLLCTAKVHAVAEDSNGNAFSLGRSSRSPSHQMMRQLRYRDRGCRFPGCGSRAFADAHHVEYWSRGGATDLSNLVLLCSFHHRLVHERGWSLRFEHGEAVWHEPNGRRYLGGPSPGEVAARERAALQHLEQLKERIRAKERSGRLGPALHAGSPADATDPVPRRTPSD